jgi:hypothetical protein
MKTFTLLRLSENTMNGVYGQLIYNEMPVCCTFELPWRANAPRISCIPEGEYKATLTMSPKRGYQVYELSNVPNRGDIQVHKGNHAGHSLGCVLLGQSFGQVEETDEHGNKTGKKYLGLWNSSIAFLNFMALTAGDKEITLNIVNVSYERTNK